MVAFLETDWFFDIDTRNIPCRSSSLAEVSSHSGDSAAVRNIVVPSANRVARLGLDKARLGQIGRCHARDTSGSRCSFAQLVLYVPRYELPTVASMVRTAPRSSIVSINMVF